MANRLSSEKDSEAFRERLEELRLASGRNYEQMAKHLGVSRDVYKKWISGTYRKNGDKEKIYTLPSASVLCQIADKLDVSIDYLLGRSDFLTAESGFASRWIGLDEQTVRAVRGYDPEEKKCLDRLVQADDLLRFTTDSLLRYAQYSSMNYPIKNLDSDTIETFEHGTLIDNLSTVGKLLRLDYKPERTTRENMLYNTMKELLEELEKQR